MLEQLTLVIIYLYRTCWYCYYHWICWCINKSFDVNKLDVSVYQHLNIDVNADLDVDGHTNLDNLSVAGVSTFTGIYFQLELLNS